jgi:hypothetical protein
MTSFSPKQTLLPAGFEPFNLSMIQLGSIGPDKRVNLVHAREMVLKAAAPPDKVSAGLLARQSCSVDIRGKSAIGGERYGRGRGKERKAHVLVRVWEESFDQALIVCYEAPSYRPRHSPNLLPTIPTRLADPPLLPLPLISPQEIFNSPTASHAYKSNAEPVPTPTAGHPILPSDLPSKEDAPTLHVRLPPAYLVHLSIHARFPTL